MQAQTFHVRIGDGRRVVLPSEVCRSMLLDIGDTLIIRVESDRTTLSSVDRTVTQFQAMLAARVPAGYSAVEELIAEREDASMRE
jgi:bifunctional DNA-binding transcriptional regulator/antitoxin component of YhaV-PrlF toxin-antitoxin module